jgi:hypothetical protein
VGYACGIEGGTDLARTLLSVLTIVAIFAGCGAPSETGATADPADKQAIHGEGFDDGTGGAVAEEDFDTGSAEHLAVGEEAADGQETQPK